ncbi:MAG: AAA family ATPase [Patescibacteria group bacterium]|nr:AAA family ATPase [Patescibacteria group bacterium]
MPHPAILDVRDRLSGLDQQVLDGRISVTDAIKRYAYAAKDSLGMSHLASAVPHEAVDEELFIPFIVTTLREDRDGDVVVPMGIETGNFELNAVWFFGHQQHPIPIGKGVKDGKLSFAKAERLAKAGCWFDPRDPDSVMIYHKVKDGFLNATSIAFVPLQARRRDREEEKGIFDRAHPHTQPMQPPGWLFERVDLTEISIVGVPSNAGAIRDIYDSEKSHMSPRLQKAWLPYCAKSFGRSFSGWCPPGTVKCPDGTCQPVTKAHGRPEMNEPEPPEVPSWDVIVDGKAWGKVDAADEVEAIETAKWQIDQVRRKQMPKDYTEEEFRARFPKPKVEVQGPYSKGVAKEPDDEDEDDEVDTDLYTPREKAANSSLIGMYNSAGKVGSVGDSKTLLAKVDQLLSSMSKQDLQDTWAAMGMRTTGSASSLKDKIRTAVSDRAGMALRVEADLDNAVEKAPPREKWNKSLSSTFDQMPELQLEDGGKVGAATTHRVSAKYIGCQIKDLHQSQTMVPSPRIGSFLAGLQHVLKDFRVVEVRNLSDRSEQPPVYEAIQLKSDLRGTFLVQGMMFIEHVSPRGKRPGPAVVQKGKDPQTGLDYSRVRIEDRTPRGQSPKHYVVVVDEQVVARGFQSKRDALARAQQEQAKIDAVGKGGGQHNKSELPNPSARSEAAGKAAALAGKGKANCPYKYPSGQWQSWMDGWEDGKAEYEDTHPGTTLGEYGPKKKGAGPHNNYGRGVGDKRIVVKLSPEWGGINVKVLTRLQDAGLNQSIIDGAWQWAKANNYLKGEAFALSGEFLQRTAETWDDVFLEAGNRKTMQRTLELFNAKGLGFANRGVILTGPPGTGKTLSSRVFRNQAKGTFIWVSARDFYHSNGSAGGFAMAFEMAKELAPSVLVFEDVDNWLTEKSIDLLKTEMDGMARSKGVLTILTTNFPEQLPQALIDRPGRFHDVLEFGLPDEVARKAMLRKWLPQVPQSHLDVAVERSAGYSGAHVYELAHFAKSLQEHDDLAPAAALDEAVRKVEEQRQLVARLQDHGAGYDRRRRRSAPGSVAKSDAPVVAKSHPAGEWSAGEWPEIELGVSEIPHEVGKDRKPTGESMHSTGLSRLEWLRAVEFILKNTTKKPLSSYTTADVSKIYSSGATPQQGAVAIVATAKPGYEGPYKKQACHCGGGCGKCGGKPMKGLGQIGKMDIPLPERAGRMELPPRDVNRIYAHCLQSVFGGDTSVEQLPEWSAWKNAVYEHYVKLRTADKRMEHRRALEQSYDALRNAAKRAGIQVAPKGYSQVMPDDGEKSVNKNFNNGEKVIDTSSGKSGTIEDFDDSKGLTRYLIRYDGGGERWVSGSIIRRKSAQRIVSKYITHDGNTWTVHAESGKVLGRHSTKEDAERQLRVVEANKQLAEQSGTAGAYTVPVDAVTSDMLPANSETVCTECSGSGECPDCDGAGVVGDAPCTMCGGSGECGLCGGSGMVAKSVRKGPGEVYIDELSGGRYEVVSSMPPYKNVFVNRTFASKDEAIRYARQQGFRYQGKSFRPVNRLKNYLSARR